MTQTEKESLQTIQELVALIGRTETLVEVIGRMVPVQEHWLAWRYRTMTRKLEDARRELKVLIEQAQVQALRASVLARRHRQG